MSHDAACEQVFNALERTLGRGTARMRFGTTFDLSERAARPSGPLPRHLRLGHKRMVWWVRKRTRFPDGHTMWQLGFLDFETPRCLYGWTSTATLVVRDRCWKGEPGTPIVELFAQPAPTAQPLWLLDLVRGVTEAGAQREELLDGHDSRRFSAYASLSRAAQAVPYAMPGADASDLVVDHKRLPLELWLDGEDCIRRILLRYGLMRMTLDLLQFGDEPPDWSCLQRFAAAGGGS